jgi:hypothetical protein
VLLLSEALIDIGARVSELAGLYKSQNKPANGLKVLKKYLDDHRDYGYDEIHVCYLELLNDSGLNITEAAIAALNATSSCEMLQKIAAFNVPDLPRYEKILETKSSGQLLEYFDREKRFEEGLALIKRNSDIWEADILKFFKKHKKLFPQDAENYFIAALNKNLEFTGDFYYNAVADALRQLIQINKPLALKNINFIRAQYKRRRNLIALLAEID